MTLTKMASTAMFSVSLGLLAGQTQAQNNQNGEMSTIDTFAIFFWMEDACLGDGPEYKWSDDRNNAFIESIRGVRNLPIVNDYGDPYEFIVKPKSQWDPNFRDIIKDVSIDVNSEYTEYHIQFNDKASYRGERLDEYHFKFRPESEGGQHVLKFAKTADTDYVWSEFKVRQVEDWAEGRTYESKAHYDKKNKSFQCYF